MRPRATVRESEAAARRCEPWVRDGYRSIQVNVDAEGCNILGDAANEPSIATDPTDPRRIVIGWRQFDTVESSFRQAGVAYSRDSGRNWTFPGVLDPGVFRSDPVLGADADGTFYYHSLHINNDGLYITHLFRSEDHGISWSEPVYSYGGDKAWMAIDRTKGSGRGHLYFAWDQFGCCGNNIFNRSVDGGTTFSLPVPIPSFPIFGTVVVGTDGGVYVAGARADNASTFVVIKSTNAVDPMQSPSFQSAANVPMLGSQSSFQFASPNPGGLLGQVWIAVDLSRARHLYLLASVNPTGSDPLDVHFSRSVDGGRNWSPAVRVNDDVPGNWQWFGTMSVAPNGRIDVVWNDTRNGADFIYSELYYTFSDDAGMTWATSVAVSPMFDSWVGWPQQEKIGDYYHMESDNLGANLAYAATFNGEQDVYFLRIGSSDCNVNGLADDGEIASGSSIDRNRNGIPDECECGENCVIDLDGNGRVNLADFRRYPTCLTGPADGDLGDCGPHDLSQDGHIDLRDLADFQNWYIPS
ncbi:MAG: sialidase family protein [Planctomycetota bacterium]